MKEITKAALMGGAAAAAIAATVGVAAPAQAYLDEADALTCGAATSTRWLAGEPTRPRCQRGADAPTHAA